MTAPDDPTTPPSVWLSLIGAEVAQRFYDVGGVRTRVIEAGDGPPVILLHGTGGHAEAYQRNIVDLARDFRVVAVDMIGHGFTDGPDVDYTHDDFADHIVGLMDVMGIEKASLSGESLGANVAAWIALTRPERVDRLVMNTGVLAHASEKGARQYDDLVARTERLAHELSYETIQARLRWLVLDPDTMSDEMVRIRHHIYSQPGMLDTVLRVVRAVVAQHKGVYKDKDYMTPGIMRDITHPTLVLWTAHNPGKSVDVAKQAAEGMPDVRFEVFEHSAHWPQYEEADAFNALHREFLLG